MLQSGTVSVVFTVILWSRGSCDDGWNGSGGCIYGGFVGLSWEGPRAVHGPGPQPWVVGERREWVNMSSHLSSLCLPPCPSMIHLLPLLCCALLISTPACHSAKARSISHPYVPSFIHLSVHMLLGFSSLFFLLFWRGSNSKWKC